MALNVSKQSCVDLLTALEYEGVEKWSIEKITKKMLTLPKNTDKDTDAGEAALNEMLDDVLKELKDGGDITITEDEAEDDEEGAEAANEGEEEPEEKPAKKNKKGDKKSAKPEKAEKKSDKGKDKKKGKAKKPAKEKKEPKEKKPGVIASIVEILKTGSAKKPLTKTQIHDRLKKKFPDRPEASMWTTINIQVPSRLRVDRNVVVQKNTEGYWVNPNEK